MIRQPLNIIYMHCTMDHEMDGGAPLSFMCWEMAYRRCLADETSQQEFAGMTTPIKHLCCRRQGSETSLKPAWTASRRQ